MEKLVKAGKHTKYIYKYRLKQCVLTYKHSLMWAIFAGTKTPLSGDLQAEGTLSFLHHHSHYVTLIFSFNSL